MHALIFVMCGLSIYGLIGGHVGGGLMALLGVLLLAWADRRMSSLHREHPGDPVVPDPTIGPVNRNPNPDLDS